MINSIIRVNTFLPKIVKQPLINALFLSTILISNNLFAQESTSEKIITKQAHNYPGGIVELRLKKQTDQLPEVRFGIQEPVILEQEHYWHIIIGLGLDMLAGEYLVYIKRSVEDASAHYEKINVTQKNYPLSENQVEKNTPPDRYKSLSDLEYSNSQQPSLPLSLPTQGQWNTLFGERSFNQKNKKTKQQNYLYLTVNKKHIIHAPQNGIISKISKGKDGLSSVFLDHGRGLYSIISGLTELTIETGNGVVTGAVIGTVTPLPKLKKQRIYWQSVMNNTFINPLILTKL